MHDEIRNGKGHNDFETESFFGLEEVRCEKGKTCEDGERLSIISLLQMIVLFLLIKLYSI